MNKPAHDWRGPAPTIGATVTLTGWDDTTLRHWESDDCTVVAASPRKITVEDANGYRITLTHRRSGVWIQVHHIDAWYSPRLATH